MSTADTLDMGVRQHVLALTPAATVTAYDPYGQAIDPVTGLIGTTTGDDAIPDELAGSEDYGWAGGAGKLTEHVGGLDTIEMGTRQYVPALGLFLSLDPVPGGTRPGTTTPMTPSTPTTTADSIFAPRSGTTTATPAATVSFRK